MHVRRSSVILLPTLVSYSCLLACLSEALGFFFLFVCLFVFFVFLHSGHCAPSWGEKKASDLYHFLETGIYKAEEINCGLWPRTIPIVNRSLLGRVALCCHSEEYGDFI